MKRNILIGTGITVLSLLVWIGVIYAAILVAKSRVPVTLNSSFYTSGMMNSFAAAEGTWVIEGQKQAFPLQITKINCFAEMKHCFSATAQLSDNERLAVDLELFEIAEWTKTHVVFVNDSPLCVQYVYTINWVTKSVTGVRQKRAKPKEGASNCQLLDHELRLSLRSGFDVWYSLQDEALPWFGKVALAPLKWIFR